MKMMNRSLLAGIILTISSTANAALVDTMIEEYRTQGANNISAERGKSMWTQKHQNSKDGKMRSCATCHTDNLRASGEHAKTGKTIDPLAPSVVADRLTDRKKINKWFKRNCKWTLGRECNAQEKADFLSYIRTQ